MFSALSRYAGWYKIIFDQAIGFVESEYVNLTEIPYENQDSENSPLFFKNGMRGFSFG